MCVAVWVCMVLVYAYASCVSVCRCVYVSLWECCLCVCVFLYSVFHFNVTFAQSPAHVWRSHEGGTHGSTLSYKSYTQTHKRCSQTHALIQAVIIFYFRRTHTHIHTYRSIYMHSKIQILQQIAQSRRTIVWDQFAFMWIDLGAFLLFLVVLVTGYRLPRLIRHLRHVSVFSVYFHTLSHTRIHTNTRTLQTKYTRIHAHIHRHWVSFTPCPCPVPLPCPLLSHSPPPLPPRFSHFISLSFSPTVSFSLLSRFLSLSPPLLCRTSIMGGTSSKPTLKSGNKFSKSA